MEMEPNPWKFTPNVREYKLCLLGDGGVGKSALTVRFIQNVFSEEYDPTIEDWYRKQCVIDNEIALLDVLDAAGQDEFVAMREQYMRTHEGFMLVYSVTSRASFEQVSPLYRELLRVRGVVSCPVIIVGNKCDMEFERQVTAREGRSLAEKMGGVFMETSAKERIQVDDAFYGLVREIRNYNRMGQRSRQMSLSVSGDRAPGTIRTSQMDPQHEPVHSGRCLSGCVIV